MYQVSGYFVKTHKSWQLPDNGKDVGETSERHTESKCPWFVLTQVFHLKWGSEGVNNSVTSLRKRPKQCTYMVGRGVAHSPIHKARLLMGDNGVIHTMSVWYKQRKYTLH